MRHCHYPGSSFLGFLFHFALIRGLRAPLFFFRRSNRAQFINYYYYCYRVIAINKAKFCIRMTYNSIIEFGRNFTFTRFAKYCKSVLPN